jgi:predicted amino acid racemase
MSNKESSGTMAPRLFVNLKAITDNTRKTIDLCHGFGVEVVGVTKGVSGLPPWQRP